MGTRLPFPDAGEPPSVPGASIDAVERYVILKTLEHCDGSTSKAAAMLGISSRKVQYRLVQYREGTRG